MNPSLLLYFRDVPWFIQRLCEWVESFVIHPSRIFVSWIFWGVIDSLCDSLFLGCVAWFILVFANELTHLLSSFSDSCDSLLFFHFSFFSAYTDSMRFFFFLVIQLGHPCLLIYLFPLLSDSFVSFNLHLTIPILFIVAWFLVNTVLIVIHVGNLSLTSDYYFVIHCDSAWFQVFFNFVIQVSQMWSASNLLGFRSNFELRLFRLIYVVVVTGRLRLVVISIVWRLII